MKRISIEKAGKITNSWTDDVHPENYTEPGFGATGTYTRIIQDITVEVAAQEQKKTDQTLALDAIKLLGKKKTRTLAETNDLIDKLLLYLGIGE